MKIIFTLFGFFARTQKLFSREKKVVFMMFWKYFPRSARNFFSLNFSLFSWALKSQRKFFTPEFFLSKRNFASGEWSINQSIRHLLFCVYWWRHLPEVLFIFHFHRAIFNEFFHKSPVFTSKFQTDEFQFCYFKNKRKTTFVNKNSLSIFSKLILKFSKGKIWNQNLVQIVMFFLWWHYALVEVFHWSVLSWTCYNYAGTK